MSRKAILSSILLSVGLIISGQESNPEIQIPSNPAMGIIGIQSAEINKPGNYTGVYANLISPILSNNGTIPTDLAMEFSPYYLQSRDLTWRELQKTNLFRDLRISIASNSVLDSTDSPFSRMGLGFRTNLLTGKINEQDKKGIDMDWLAQIQAVKGDIQDDDIVPLDDDEIEYLLKDIKDESAKKKIKKILEDNREDKEKLIAELDALRTRYEELRKVDGSKYSYSLRTGSFLELAGAFALDFPQNTINYSKVTRWGIWINYTYRPSTENEAIDIGIIGRISNYSFDPTIIFDEGSVCGDLGISLNLRIPKSKFIFSCEFVGKAGLSDIKFTESENQHSYSSLSESKWNAAIGYQITPATLWSISFSDIAGNSDYLKDNTMQFLMSLSAALAPMKK